MSKKYILIQNDGEIETNSFELIGASTKREDAGKIGFFGSGLKYSIAYMMRKGIDFKVFSGEQELKFTTVPETLKDQTFDRICINGKPTSYTVTMGPTWTEDWYVLREIYCNGLDENNCQLIKETENINPVKGKTRIYISLTDSIKEVVEKWDSYFSMDREAIFTAENAYTTFLGNSDIGGQSRQTVSVFNKTDGVIFRKGIRVYDSKEFAYDYDFEFVNINEDRTAKNSNAMGYVVVNLIAGFHNADYIKSILRTYESEKPCTEYWSMNIYSPEDYSFSDRWVAFGAENILVVKEIAGKYSEQISRTKKEVFYIPASFARLLKKKMPAISILGMGKIIGDASMQEIERTAKMEYLLKEVLASLKQMNYDIPYNIEVVQFDDDKILGQADVKEKIIYLSHDLFYEGRREIALVLIEETEHIASKHEDETRAFQSHLISQWLKSMENNNGLFL